ncbi:MAG: hypothetical protein KatS3mg053_1026 [Candidatus Roseilinea sp.]|nr:MAG: hypothetical protein KatS3mg053_1026 [Candidatus Roseilinea sp.]
MTNETGSRSGRALPRSLFVLSLLIALLALIAAAGGLFWPHVGEPFPFTTLRGDEIEITGRGLYAYDWAFRAPILRGTDAVMLFVATPLLVAALWAARRGGLRSRLLLTGLLGVFLYNAASVAFGVAFNPFFPVYLAYFSASLFAFVLAFSTVAQADLAAATSPRLPRRGIASFVVLASLSTGVWLAELLPALAQGEAPASIASYTTDVTALLDLGILLPAGILGGVLLWRGRPLGVLLSCVLLTLLTLTGLSVAGQTVMMMLEGNAPSAGETALYVVPFLLLSLVAVGLLTVLLRHVDTQ